MSDAAIDESRATAPESFQAKLVVWGLSATVLILVSVVMFGVESTQAANAPSTIASLNAVLNGSAGAFVIAGLVFVKRKQINLHKRCMMIAFALSIAFLLGYVAHHAQVGSIKFQGQGAIRTIYFGLLIPHIILAAPVVPLALFTIYRGWTNRIERHRRIAKITLPIWLYVSLSGVLLYFMLYHMV